MKNTRQRNPLSSSLLRKREHRVGKRKKSGVRVGRRVTLAQQSLRRPSGRRAEAQLPVLLQWVIPRRVESPAVGAFGLHSFLMCAGRWLFPFALSLRMCVYKEVISSQTCVARRVHLRGGPSVVCVITVLSSFLSCQIASQACGEFQGHQVPRLPLF